MIKELENLCLINGVSGDEGRVRDYIISKIKDKTQITVDKMGNVIAFLKGKKRPKNKIMIAAHMDEVGFIVNYINDDGTIKISPVGGIDAGAVLGKRIIINEKTPAVVGTGAIHNLSKEDRDKAADFSNMCADIGSLSKEKTLERVNLGDSAEFMSEFIEFGDGFVKGKAIDDRAGCALMMRLIEQGLEYDTYFVFTVQEEVGLRGAKCAAYSVKPDYAFVLEATTASDVADVQGEDRVCELGKGPVVSYMDKAAIYDKELFKLAFAAAKQNNIPCQTKTKIAGGNDAGSIAVSNGGVRTCAVSLPCRYLHSPSCVIKKDDFENTYKLIRILLDRTFNR